MTGGVAVARLDLNADLGEGGTGDEELLGVVTSANIACGGHAGDEASMRAACALAAAHGVHVGAHPSYPDREHFGRRPLDLPGFVLAQLAGALTAAALMGWLLRGAPPDPRPPDLPAGPGGQE